MWRRVGEEMLMGKLTVDVGGEGLGMGVRDWVVGMGEEVAVEAAVTEMTSEEVVTVGAMLAVVKVAGRWRVVGVGNWVGVTVVKEAEMREYTAMVEVGGEGAGVGDGDRSVGLGMEPVAKAVVIERVEAHVVVTEIVLEQVGTGVGKVWEVKVVGAEKGVVGTEVKAAVVEVGMDEVVNAVAYFSTFGGKKVVGMMVGCKNVS